MDDNLFRIINAAVELIALALGLYLIPTVKNSVKEWLDRRKGDKKYEVYERVYEFARWAVYAAQQVLWTQPGSERKSFAAKLIKELCRDAGIQITDGQISTIIETAVHELRIAEGAYAKEGTTDGDSGAAE